MELDLLLSVHGSDKDSQNSYGPLYHALFSRTREQVRLLIEVGIGTLTPNVHSSMYGHDLPGYAPGASLRAWRQFFSGAVIVGFDTQPDCMFTDERIVTRLVDSTNLHDVDAVMRALFVTRLVDSTNLHDVDAVMRALFDSTNPRDVDIPVADIIIDDGSHDQDDQLQTFVALYPYLREHGTYIIEDVRYLSLDNLRETISVHVAGKATVLVVPFPKAAIIVITKRNAR